MTTKFNQEVQELLMNDTRKLSTRTLHRVSELLFVALDRMSTMYADPLQVDLSDLPSGPTKGLIMDLLGAPRSSGSLTVGQLEFMAEAIRHLAGWINTELRSRLRGEYISIARSALQPLREYREEMVGEHHLDLIEG